ncbi:hypothetical protein NEDG_00093 [Nematocida displodere]|uniref:BRCA2 OB1 domain-containing protein n=1 Tax=Nematocida displodere TaxID=1805483 RepID=A0A177EIB0_9MICR|nr:hypothetical protein NEDG_00093 [Nematocida displodere]
MPNNKIPQESQARKETDPISKRWRKAKVTATRPVKENAKLPPEQPLAPDMSGILWENAILLPNNKIAPAAPLDAAGASERYMTDLLDATFFVEEKEYPFVSDADTTDTDIRYGPFYNKDNSLINKTLTDKIFNTNLNELVTPPRKKVKCIRTFSSPLLVDPDESLDIETGLLNRDRSKESPAKKPLADVIDENQNLIKRDKPEKDEQKNFPYFPGFRTATGKNISFSEDSLIKARRSLDFLSPTSNLSPTPKSSDPKQHEIDQLLSVFRSVKREIFPITRNKEDIHTVFSTFKYAWLSCLTQIMNIRIEDLSTAGSEIEKLVVASAKERWRRNPHSPLKKIAEKDEAPGIYLKLLVVEEGTTTLGVSDGVYALTVSLDEGLRSVAKKIKVGTIIQVLGASSLLPRPLSIEEAYSSRTPVLELRYNGVKPCLSGPLGYQPVCAFIRSLCSVRMQGGIVGCLSLKLTKVIHSKYLMNLNGSKNIIEEDQLEGAVERIEATIKKMCLDREEELEILSTVRVKKFVQYEVYSAYTQKSVLAHLTIWNPPTGLSLLNKTFLFFFLNTSPYPSTTGILTLTTTAFTIIKRLP